MHFNCFYWTRNIFLYCGIIVPGEVELTKFPTSGIDKWNIVTGDGRSIAEHAQSFQHLREPSLEIAYFNRGINSKENAETVNEKSSRAVVLESKWSFQAGHGNSVPEFESVLLTIKDNHFQTNETDLLIFHQSL